MVRESYDSGAIALPGSSWRRDPFKSADWAQKHVNRWFITIVNTAVWAPMTGETPPPSVPPPASDYTKAGLPWWTSSRPMGWRPGYAIVDREGGRVEFFDHTSRPLGSGALDKTLPPAT
jgi:hypothetical protein